MTKIFFLLLILGTVLTGCQIEDKAQVETDDLDITPDGIDMGDPANHAPKITIFVTPTSYSGNLGGVKGANEICYKAKLVKALPCHGVKALLNSFETTPIADFPHIYGFIASKPVVTSNGTLLGNDWIDILDGAIFSSLSAAGEPAGNPWTGSSLDGFPDPNNCNAWTDGSAGPQGQQGNSLSATGTWIANSLIGCGTSNPLLCVCW